MAVQGGFIASAYSTPDFNSTINVMEFMLVSPRSITIYYVDKFYLTWDKRDEKIHLVFQHMQQGSLACII